MPLPFFFNSCAICEPPAAAAEKEIHMLSISGPVKCMGVWGRVERCSIVLHLSYVWWDHIIWKQRDQRGGKASMIKNWWQCTIYNMYSDFKLNCAFIALVFIHALSFPVSINMHSRSRLRMSKNVYMFRWHLLSALGVSEGRGCFFRMM